MENILMQPVFQMSLLLFVALAGYLVASRINQSAVIGLILVGILVGPSALGLITYTDFVAGLANLGAVILLFVIGLEFKIQDIVGIRNGVIAAVGVIVPWIGGYGISIAFGFDTSSAIFIGTALTATSIAITANVLREMGKLQTDAAKAIIGAAVIDDVLSLLALSVSSEVVEGVFSPQGIAFVIIKAIAFIVLAGAFGIFVVSRYIERLDRSRFARKFPEFIFIFAMMMAFFYAMMAELTGLSAIVGAFIAGVSFEGVRLTHCRDIKEGAEYLQIIFASIFFVSLGVLADLRQTDSRDRHLPHRAYHCGNSHQGDRVWNTGEADGSVNQGLPYCRVWHGAERGGRHDRRTDRAPAGDHRPESLRGTCTDESRYNDYHPNRVPELVLQGGVSHG